MLASESFYYVFITQDPADNLFLCTEENKKIADSKVLDRNDGINHKDLFEENHEYSVQEAAMMVTLPNNLIMIPVYLCASFFYLIQVGVEELRKRQIVFSVQIISIIPHSDVCFITIPTMS